MMMGLGFLFMLAVLAVPMLLLAGLVILMVRPGLMQGNAPPPTDGSPMKMDSAGSSVCSHCGAKLQPAWAHCPQCGAPSQSLS